MDTRGESPGHQTRRSPRRGRRWALLAVVAVAAVVFVAGVVLVGSQDSPDGGQVSLADLAPPGQCAMFDDLDLGGEPLSSGLVAGTSIGPLWMVLLDSPELSAAVAAQLMHPDLVEPGFAVWALPRQVDPDGGMVSSNETARRFSDWPPATVDLAAGVVATLERCARWAPGASGPPSVDALGDLGDGIEVVAANDERPYAVAVRSRRVDDGTQLICVELTLTDSSATGCGVGVEPISVATTSGPDGTWTFGSAPPDATIVEFSDGDHVVATATVITNPALPQLGAWATDQSTSDARFVTAYDDTANPIAAVATFGWDEP